MSAFEIIRDRDQECWAVIDSEGFEVACFDTLHAAETFVIEGGGDE